MPPEVVLKPFDIALRPLDNEYVFHRWSQPHRFINDDLEREFLATTETAVGRDDNFCFRVVDTRAQRVGAEAAEDDVVDCPDASAGQHRHDRFGDHRQVDRYSVELAHTQGSQSVGCLAHLSVQLRVRDRASIACFTLEVDRYALT